MVAPDIKRADLFAATPPVEAKKALFSLAVTQGVGYDHGCKEKGLKLDFIDVRRAYFHAKARRAVYVKLPEEDAAEGMCGRLLKALYGTRDAAQNWEFEYIEFLEKAGFKKGRATPSMFYHEEKDVRVVVHGDDFTALGVDADLDWYEAKLQEHFEIKIRGAWVKAALALRRFASRTVSVPSLKKASPMKPTLGIQTS